MASVYDKILPDHTRLQCKQEGIGTRSLLLHGPQKNDMLKLFKPQTLLENDWLSGHLLTVKKTVLLLFCTNGVLSRESWQWIEEPREMSLGNGAPCYRKTFSFINVVLLTSQRKSRTVQTILSLDLQNLTRERSFFFAEILSSVSAPPSGLHFVCFAR